MINSFLRFLSKKSNLDPNINILTLADKKKIQIFKNLKKINIKKRSKKENILIVNGGYYDGYNFCFIHLLLNSKKMADNNVFYAPTTTLNLSYHKNLFLWILKFILRELSIIFERKKIKIFFNSLKEGLFFYPSNLKKIFCFRLFLKSINLFKNIKTKKDLENFKYKNVKIGDLVYDTYIRYKKEKTVNLKSKFLLFLIFTAIYNFEKYNYFFIKNKIRYVFSVDNAYIHNGLIQRLSIYKKINYYVFSRTLPINQHIKKNSKKDFSNHPSYYESSKIFLKLKNKRNKIIEAKKLLTKKFKGEIIPQESYMLKTAFSNIKKKIDKYEAIIFLHDFMDTAHGLGKNVFPDYYEWFINTLNFLRKNKLNKKVAIKVHPNSIWISKTIEKKLKEENLDFVWLDPKISNKYIFKKISKFGITVHGTIIGELAYHGIPAVSCGNNQAMSFKFNFNATTEKKYYDFLIKGFNNQLKLPQNTHIEVCKMAYMQYLHKNPGIDLLLSPNELKNLKLESGDKSISNYIKLYKSRTKKNDYI